MNVRQSQSLFGTTLLKVAQQLVKHLAVLIALFPAGKIADMEVSAQERGPLLGSGEDSVVDANGKEGLLIEPPSFFLGRYHISRDPITLDRMH